MRTNRLLLLLALLMTAATGAWAQPWTSGDCSVTLSGGVLTVSKTSGTGAMADYANASAQPWNDSRYNITSIVVGEGVTHIGNSAFRQCTMVTSISLPTSLTSIGTYAFQACNNAGLTSITIPENVESIGTFAFHGCNKLTSVTIGNSVTTIGQSAFQNCSGLTSVTIGNSVTTIGNAAFSGCSSLTTITIPDNVGTIGNTAFRDCSGLTTITIPSGVTTIGQSAFNGCSSLETVTVLAQSCTLGTIAFDGCTSLTAIYVPSGKVDTYKGAEHWSDYAAYIQGDPNDEPAGPTSYTVSMKSDVKDADKWRVKVGEGQAQALPIGGLKGDGSETVTLQYNGRLKVKGVKATSDAAATVPVTAITLNKTETSIKVGATETLSVTSVLPEEATDKTYTWKTSDVSKATVDQDGKVTAVAEGTVTIYAEANDGSGVKGNCAVTVTPAGPITVTWNNDDIPDSGHGKSFTKDGVTITAGEIDFREKNFMMGGTFTTTLGNFTKIEVTTGGWNASGTGWSGSRQSATWTGTPASSVSFSDDIYGMRMGNTKFVFTIE